jgi:hypothetical protein
MSDEQPTACVHGSDEDIVFTIAHALRHQGRKVTHQADQLVARVVAERILEAMKRAYIIPPKPPQLGGRGVKLRWKAGIAPRLIAGRANFDQDWAVGRLRVLRLACRRRLDSR